MLDSFYVLSFFSINEPKLIKKHIRELYFRANFFLENKDKILIVYENDKDLKNGLFFERHTYECKHFFLNDRTPYVWSYCFLHQTF